MKAYPVELRTRIVCAVEQGRTRTAVAQLFAVSLRTVARYLAQYRRDGDLTPRHSPGRPPAIGQEQAAALRAQVAAAPDATLATHCQRWEAAQGVRVSVATMSRALQQGAITRKKSPPRRRAR